MNAAGAASPAAQSLPGASPAPAGTPTRPARLGMLGGGQLGRMFVHAAQRLGHHVTVLDPDPASPAAAAADAHLPAAYPDPQALAQLARHCDAISTEFENVPAAALRHLAALGAPVAPGADAVAVCQHRLLEKQLFQRAGVACAPHKSIESDSDCTGPDVPLLLPGLLKTATLGYDGKGQVRVATPAELAAAFAMLGRRPCVLERRLELAAELSVVVARARGGACVHLPVVRNWHREGILAVTEAPAAGLPAGATAAAVAHSLSLAEALGYVGVLCVEFFVLQDGQLLANEMAPRPHNSGHHSIDACDVSQFELQVRTMLDLPLPPPRQHSPALMLNLLGDLWFDAASGTAREPAWPAVLALPGAHLHLYGKSEARPGRKMGHLTLTGPDVAQVRRHAAQAVRMLGLPPLPAELLRRAAPPAAPL